MPKGTGYGRGTPKNVTEAREREKLRAGYSSKVVGGPSAAKDRKLLEEHRSRRITRDVAAESGRGEFSTIPRGFQTDADRTRERGRSKKK